MTSSKTWHDLNVLIDKYRTVKGIWWPKLKVDNEFNSLFNSEFQDCLHLDIQAKALICISKFTPDDYKCPCCSNIKRFNKNKNVFFKYCSDECKFKKVGDNISSSLKLKYLDDNLKNIAVNKRKQTNLEKYGYDCQFSGLSDQIKQTNLEKYGVDNFFKQDMKVYQLKDGKLPQQEHMFNLENMTEQFLIANFMNNDKFNMFKASEYFNCSYDILRKKLKEFNINYKMHNQSYAELYLYDYISNVSNVIQNDRNLFNIEIDLIIEDKNFGIEYDGLMFHSFGKSNSSMFNNSDKIDINYHKNKTDILEKNNFQLFHIFENEWKTKQNIWLSMINNKLGIYNSKIFARKCIIKEISSFDANKFIFENHIQGIRQAKVKLGLFYNNELVSVMTFGAPNNDKNYEYELIRFCNKLNTIVTGAASRLLKYFETNYKPKSLVTYANRRWSQGNLYNKIGFNYSHISEPNFYYFNKTNILYSRQKFQKFKLEKLLDKYDSNLSARENMFNNGYRIIYDSGNIVFTKNYKQI